VPLSRTNFANMHSIFDFSAENAKIEDCLAEQGGFEPPVSRENLSAGKGARGLEIFGVEIRLHLPENEFAFGSVRCPSLTAPPSSHSNGHIPGVRMLM
jgi:hypothetical protein